ncbi:Uma2 family endonuclease [Thermosynechococcus sp. HN-54]|uniref:Uma2 family endonuclease n=1 Tax=Thermosynechococcus sp. HN-54 TaxID=2933959 RepID=UPI00202CEAB7|nr:Uma2 family endonuclease [Thermosynechococcus sp. HN-54]URR34898.1 Uma2 family endonuclease [Thermosynechococcus sp. HN-54]
MIALNLRPTIELTDEAFEQLCRSNPDLRLERSAQGELIAMAPAGSESSRQNLSLSAQLWYWNQQMKLGVTFDSSAGFTLANGAIRSPDAAWIEKSRWQRLTPEQRRRFAPICPDFVLELKSPTDDLASLQAKMQEYVDNGAQLGWLIDSETHQVYCYQLGQAMQLLEHPSHLSGEPVLPNFVMDLTLIWD